MTQRLIETWLPIAQIGIESLRERTPMTPYPAPNRSSRLVGAPSARCFPRRDPGVAAAGGCGPREVHARAGDPRGSRRRRKKRIDRGRSKGERLGADAYGYSSCVFLQSDRRQTSVDPRPR